jgi:formate hydrogenlyase transcriptional activator
MSRLCGSSRAIRRINEAIRQVAPTDATVLIQGETGTGKEVIANAIHQCSARSRAPLVKVNCAAIPDGLLASELFGHERGAFTGAVERRKGRFEQADGGTLFLDEIGEMPRDAQVMLLRVLQERELERLGGTQTIRVDVRLIAATNRDVEHDVRCERFRRDLFYRLNVFPICVPPLREHPEDIPELLHHFVAKYSTRLGRTICQIEPDALHHLRACEWPGNVRELENIVERAVILSQDGVLRFNYDADESAIDPDERAAIEDALCRCRGRVAGPKGAARMLGVPASTLEFRIRRVGIDKYRYRGIAPRLEIVSS